VGCCGVLLILLPNRARLKDFVVGSTSGNEKLTRPEHATARRYSIALITCLIRV
jgi:hypothetical protein